MSAPVETSQGEDGAEKCVPSRPQRRGSASRGGAPIDIRETLEAPVRIKQHGASRPVDPYEAMLRQHIRKSLVEKCVASMKFVLSEAEKHRLIKPPPPPCNGGVFVVPKEVPEAIQREIFDDPGYGAGNSMPMWKIFKLLLTVISIERLKRCFGGRRNESR